MSKTYQILAGDLPLGSVELSLNANGYLIGRLHPSKEYAQVAAIFQRYSVLSCNANAREPNRAELCNLEEQIQMLRLSVKAPSGDPFTFKRIQLTDITSWADASVPKVVTIEA